jgi:antitoxin MazE
MKVQSKVQKWGNGLAIRISGIMRDIPHFKDGTPIEVDVTENGLIIKIIKKTKGLKFPYSEQELLAKITAENSHADLLVRPSKDEF